VLRSLCCLDYRGRVATKSILILLWLVVSTPLKNISQLGWLFPIYGKNLPKCSSHHQPVIINTLFHFHQPCCFGIPSFKIDHPDSAGGTLRNAQIIVDLSAVIPGLPDHRWSPVGTGTRGTPCAADSRNRRASHLCTLQLETILRNSSDLRSRTQEKN
jgi:hypothetical protein